MVVSIILMVVTLALAFWAGFEWRKNNQGLSIVAFMISCVVAFCAIGTAVQDEEGSLGQQRNLESETIYVVVFCSPEERVAGLTHRGNSFMRVVRLDDGCPQSRFVFVENDHRITPITFNNDSLISSVPVNGRR